MRTRTILGALIAVAVVALLFFDPLLFGARQRWPFFKIMAFVVVMWALVEFYRLARRARANPVFEVGIAATLYYLVQKYEFAAEWLRSLGFLPLLVSVILLSVILRMRRGDARGALTDVAVTVFGFLYVTVLFGYIIELRRMGLFVLLLFLAVVKVGDVAAYYVGTAFGRHKLVPRLSPRKTVEGAIAGLAGAVLVSLLWSFGKWPIGWLIVFALLAGLLGQVGDIIESLFKRDASAKDSGAVLPEFGGVLDIIDSLLPSAPVAYYIAQRVLAEYPGVLR